MDYDASMKALNMSVGKEKIDLQYDINGDGKVTSADALAIAQAGQEAGTFYRPEDYNPNDGPPELDLTEVDYGKVGVDYAGQ